jgi:hypothetical protein
MLYKTSKKRIQYLKEGNREKALEDLSENEKIYTMLFD